MARFIGPKHKICRRLGEKVCSTDKCPLTRRNYPPGVHGVKGRGKLTPFGRQLREKQKARYTYGLLERQFENYYKKAIKKVGATDVILLQLLETRLDNIVWRLGFAKTRAAARQLVNHGHIQINDKNVDIPSCQVKPGQIISVDPNSLKSSYFLQLQKNWGKQLLQDWLAIDLKGLKGQFTALPTLAQVGQNIDMSLIVEYYSR
ncbi:MAG: 30S ribosomal protein S4 [Patescibacteria group bacterium]